MATKYHAWYSEAQERNYNESGCAAYIYLDESGKEIKITEVREVSLGNQPISRYDDLKYLGIVVKWIRHAEPIIDQVEFNLAKQLADRIEKEHRISQRKRYL
jgi:hypothetical protein